MDDHRLFLRPPAWLPVLLAIILGASFIAGKKVETQAQWENTISVQGEGKVTAVPDIAQLNFGVETGAQKTAEAAMKMLSTKMKKIFDATKAKGVEEKDISTLNLSLNPSYDWVEGRRIDRGFEARQTLRVKVRDLASISEVLDAAVSAGANQAGGVSFTIDDPQMLRTEAREKAIAEAKAKAKVLASQLGVSLGSIRGFSEGGGHQPPIAYMERSMAMDAGGMGGGMDTPLPAGEQEVKVMVTITYSIR